MGTVDPEAELAKWKRELVPAIELSCRSHYGPETKLPTFPWFLDLAHSAEVKEVLSRLKEAANRNPRAFSEETAAYLERTTLELRDKQQFNLVNQVELMSVLRKAQELATPNPGRSWVTCKLKSGRDIQVLSSTTAAGSNPSVELDIKLLTVKLGGRDLTTLTPKDLLAEESLERLCMETVRCEQPEQDQTLELSFRLAQADLLEVLRAKQGRLEEKKKAMDAEILRLKALVDGVMEALEIKDDPPQLREPKERYCDYCAML